MDYKNLKEKFLKTKDPLEEKYLPFISLNFDYEMKNFENISFKKENRNLLLNDSDNNTEKLSEIPIDKENDFEFNPIFNKFKNFNNKKFNDQLAPRFYRCEDVKCYKKNYLKAMISNKRIRFLNNNFDLDLV